MGERAIGIYWRKYWSGRIPTVSLNRARELIVGLSDFEIPQTILSLPLSGLMQALIGLHQSRYRLAQDVTAEMHIRNSEDYDKLAGDRAVQQ